MRKAKFISFDEKAKNAICSRCRKVKNVNKYYFLANNTKISAHYCSECMEKVLDLNEQFALFLHKNKFKNNLLNRIKHFFKHLINRKVKK